MRKLICAALLSATAIAQPASAAVTFGFAQLATFASVETNIVSVGGDTASLADSDDDYTFTFSQAPLSASAGAALATVGGSASASNSTTLDFASAAQGVFGYALSADATISAPMTADGFVSNAQASTSYFLNNYYQFTTDVDTTIDLVFTGSGINTYSGIAGPISQYYNLSNLTTSMVFGDEYVGGSASRHFDLTAGNYVFQLGGPEQPFPLVRQDDVGSQSAAYTGSLSFVIGGAPDVMPAVPEPTTWAMLLFGTGIIGHVLRRRPRAIARVRLA